jgi:hypothetical protein
MAYDREEKGHSPLFEKARITAKRMIRLEYLLLNGNATNTVVSFCSLKSDKDPQSRSVRIVQEAFIT